MLPEAPSIAGYRILERLCAGGFGAVYAAERDHPVRQRVALKVLKPGMESAAVVERFAAERQALALMDHPNIAKVIDAGVCDRGRPFVAMEFIEGRPITSYCDAHELPIHDRLALFVDLCRGVEHAHRRGLIHRDLKPDNVLVIERDGRPAPKIIDFGIAKLVEVAEAAAPTRTDAVLGTPEYMSPEQAESGTTGIDTRSDIYSLGVVLYELLAGSPPFPADYLRTKSLTEVGRVLREEEPPTPSVRTTTGKLDTAELARRRRARPDQLRLRIAGDLDWITMKALRKEREQRYASADAFAADIGRHLRHEPVLARPPSAYYLARKIVRRHRARVIATVAIFLTLIAALLALDSSWNEAAAARTREAAAVEIERQATDPLRVDDLLARAQVPWPRHADLGDCVVEWQSWLDEADAVLARAPAHEAAVAAMDSRHETRAKALAQMIDLLPGFRRVREEVASRRGLVERLWPLWVACRNSVAASPDFAGMDLQPMPCLLPLGIDGDRDRAHGRQVGSSWVFAVGGTGRIPRWVDEEGHDVAYGAPGRAQIGDDTAVLMVLVPPGSGWCGAQDADPDAPNYDNRIEHSVKESEQPVHEVTLPPFLISKCEITNAQYLRFAAATGRPRPDFIDVDLFAGPRRPVVSIEAAEAAAFCDWLGLRLPSEAEWEYACRAGTGTPFWFGDSEADLARFEWMGVKPEQGGGPHPVASPPCGIPMPNPFGLHDMLGNVGEFCSDDWFPTHDGAPGDGSPRSGGTHGTVRRGGAFSASHTFCHAARRSFDTRYAQNVRSNTDGFRPARSLR